MSTLTRCILRTAARTRSSEYASPAEDSPHDCQTRRASAHNQVVATRSAPAACRLGPADAARLADLLDRDRVGNAFLRSELRLGMDGSEWWGAFDGRELVATVLGGPLAWPYIPDAEDAPA